MSTSRNAIGLPLDQTPPEGSAGERRAIAVVSSGHFFSHLGILVLTPLFPLLKDVFGVSYTELGFALALLNLTTMVLQAPCGVLVDRLGGFRILIIGHSLMALSIFLIGLIDQYWMLLVLMMLAGCGNAVYHPADYAILSSRIHAQRMGRAFSVHTAAGHFGFAAAPFLIVRLEQALGWQPALMIAGAIGLAISGLMLLWRQDLAVEQHASKEASEMKDQIKLLFSFPILASLAFFTMIAVTQGGFTGFSTAAFVEIYEFDLKDASLPLTLFLALSAIGVLTGGVVADYFQQHRLVCMLCYGLIALLVAPLMFGSVAFWVVCALFAIAGFANGFLSPARDLLLRAITPEGRAGVVFGFVTTGFNIGGLIAPMLFGVVMDFFAPTDLFAAILFSALLTVVTLMAGQSSRWKKFRR